MSTPRTLIDRIWDSHVVHAADDGTCLLYVDRHLIQDESSPVAFERLRAAGRRARRPELALAVADHNAPTLRDSSGSRSLDLVDAASRQQIAALARNAAEFGIATYGLDDPRHGILHIVAPEQGLILPGALVVGGDSHTATHGAFGALAFGIGTAEIEAVLATQALLQRRPKTMRVTLDGTLGPGVCAKDLVLALIGRLGTGGATGHFIEYAGAAVRGLSMEGRLSLCNMSVEAGARAGLIAPDETTFAYLRGRPHVPTGATWDAALAHWRTLQSDPGAAYDAEVTLDASDLAPQVTWGTSPQDVLPITGVVPDPADAPHEDRRAAMARALTYMGLTPGTRLQDIRIDQVFIGSCTNGRIEDLREAAAVLRGREVAAGVTALVVPGSGVVKRQAEDEGLDRIFRAAGFDWREPGCSLCLAMNGDRLQPSERCAATSSRNFEGRQGRDGRTHLMSPAMAAAAAVTGRLTDVRGLARER